MPSSAQCRSSSTSSAGRSVVVSSRASTHRRVGRRPRRGGGGGRRGRERCRRASAPRPGPSAPRPVSRVSHGAWATVAPPAEHAAQRVVTWSRRAIETASRAVVVLPIPASPTSSSTRPAATRRLGERGGDRGASGIPARRWKLVHDGTVVAIWRRQSRSGAVGGDRPRRITQEERHDRHHRPTSVRRGTADRRSRHRRLRRAHLHGRDRRVRAGHRGARHAPRPVRVARRRRPGHGAGAGGASRHRRPLRARVARAAGDRRHRRHRRRRAPGRSRRPRVLAARRAPGVPRSTRTAWRAWRRSPPSPSPARASSRRSSTPTASGTGISFAGYGDDIRRAQEAGNRPQFTNLLASEWLPAMPDVVARLQAGPARVADIGCGCGWSSIAIARAFPTAVVHGYDSDEASIGDARVNADGVRRRRPGDVHGRRRRRCRRALRPRVLLRGAARHGPPGGGAQHDAAAGRRRGRGVRRRRARRRRPDGQRPRPDAAVPLRGERAALPAGRAQRGGVGGHRHRAAHGAHSTSTPQPPGSAPSRCSRSTTRCSASTGCGSRDRGHLVTLRLNGRSGHPRSRYRESG